MATKPATVPQLDTNDTNRVAPAAGDITDGYSLNDIFPAGNANFLMGLAGDWLEWFDERHDDEAAGVDYVLHALDPAAGAGGNTFLRGADSVDAAGGVGNVEGGTSVSGTAGGDGRTRGAASVGTDIDGGDGILAGGLGTGTGDSVARIQVATSGTTGSTPNSIVDYILARGATEDIATLKPIVATTDVTDTAAITATGNGTGDGITGTGGATNGIGVFGTGGATNGDGVRGQGTGTGQGLDAIGGATSGDGARGTGGAPNGVGVQGFGTGTGTGVSGIGGATGYGVVAQADTTTPVRSALRLVPQDTDPSTNLAGDVHALHPTSATHAKLAHFNGAEHERIVPQVFAGTSEEVLVGGVGSTWADVYVIPANTLRVGSVIRVFATGATVGVADGGNVDYTVQLNDGGSVGPVRTSTIAIASAGMFVIEGRWTVKTIGASGVALFGGVASHGPEATPEVRNTSGTSGTTLDSTVAVTVQASVLFSVATSGNTARLDQFVVEVT